MSVLGSVTTARLASLATGRGGAPLPEEWPFVLALMLVLAFAGTRMLVAMGLTRVESLLLAALAPSLVLLDAPLGALTPRMGLAANVTGCLIPAAISIKVMVERRAPLAEALFLLCIGIVVAYFSSHAEPERGVLLQYRLPAILIGVLSAGLLYRKKNDAAGAMGFAAGALGVIIGADIFHLQELMTADGGGRIVLGGAGLLDGILLVAVLAAAIGHLVAMALRTFTRVRAPSAPTV